MELLQHIPDFLTPFEIGALASLGMAETHLWEAGRQGTGYERLALRSLVDQDPVYAYLADRALRAIGAPHENHWDMWIIRYPSGSSIPPHRDEAAIYGLRHRRLNALVRAPRAGGDFVVENKVFPLAVGDAVLFYPDDVHHSVTQVDDVRLVFSVGAWLETKPFPVETRTL